MADVLHFRGATHVASESRTSLLDLGIRGGLRSRDSRLCRGRVFQAWDRKYKERPFCLLATIAVHSRHANAEAPEGFSSGRASGMRSLPTTTYWGCPGFWGINRLGTSYLTQ